MYVWRAENVKMLGDGLEHIGIGNFDNMNNSILELMHIMIENGWHELMYAYAIRFDNFGGAS